MSLSSAAVSGDIWNAWIDYDGIANQLEVRIAQGASIAKPHDAFLAYGVDIDSLVTRQEARRKNGRSKGFTACAGRGYNAGLPSTGTLEPARMFSHALVRVPCENFASGLTTSSRLGVPDHGLMLRQHDAYVEALRGLGLTVITLPPEDAFPDAHFVEDVAVVTPEVAVITNPGAPARNGEQTSVAPVLGRYKPLAPAPQRSRHRLPRLREIRFQPG